MAAAISAINAKIRSQPVLNYICSTPPPPSPPIPISNHPPANLAVGQPSDFWGPASNFGIPIAAIMDTQKDPEIISGAMTASLTVYSATFMRYSMAVTPRNPLLFACHLGNFGAQVTQGYRFVDYWYYGGREKSKAKGETEAEGGEGR
ncbi:MAG: hypothetical protein LQ342_006914 [Letrouitia transgressa]|nr:MAG: hypothetical protein LQ342_006914 [Letrouitia transgressa]